MQLPLDNLFRGLIYTLSEVVLPEVSSPYVRSQVMAITSILENINLRIKRITTVLEEQNTSLLSIFNRLEDILKGEDGARAKELLAEIHRVREETTPSLSGLAENNRLLKGLLEKVIVWLWERGEDSSPSLLESLDELHQSIRHFLKQEVATELSLLSPANIVGVSKGKEAN